MFKTFSSSGLGKPPDDEATDKNHSIFSSATVSVAWFAGQLQRTHSFKEAEETRWILEILSRGGSNRTVYIPILSSWDQREMSPRQSPDAQTIKPVWQQDSDSEWSAAVMKLGAGDQWQSRDESRVAEAEPSTHSPSWFQSQSCPKYVPQLLFLLLKSMTDRLFPTGICVPVTESILTPHIPALDGPRNKKNGHYASKDLGWQNLGRPQSKLSHIKGKNTFALHCLVS